ncbi:RHS repeat-associated core domain-containing protein, partial [Variovorax robiniae]
RPQAIQLSATTDVKALMRANGGRYDIEQDPLWNGQQEPNTEAFAKEEIAFYQCDHLGTPQELTDHEGNIAWSASYKAWGEAREVISEAARRSGVTNPLRFQGQYLDEETGLHYNRYRYYDPGSGRFVSSDPIKLAGGVNLQVYAPNPTEWIDPLGLMGYRVATRTDRGVDLGKTLTDKQAIQRAQRGQDVHADSRSEAVTLAKKCGPRKTHETSTASQSRDREY